MSAEILGECVRLRKHYLEEFAKKYDSNYMQGFSSVREDVSDDDISIAGPTPSTKYNSYDGDNTLHPFVLLLGNHSSGKSSFINYLLGRKVQATGTPIKTVKTSSKLFF